MTEHKCTDDEIIRVLECCTNCICNHAKTDTECPLVKMDFCKNYLMKLSLDLINRQKAEIESLEAEIDKQYEQLVINNEENYEYFDYSYTLETIDNLAEEMTEGKE